MIVKTKFMDKKIISLTLMKLSKTLALDYYFAELEYSGTSFITWIILHLLFTKVLLIVANYRIAARMWSYKFYQLCVVFC